MTKDGKAKYVGEYKNRRRHGKGMLIYPDGAKFVGIFVRGKRHGEGIYYFDDGRKEPGVWRKGIIKFPDEKLYDLS